jgi:hypothetical protein
MKKDVVVEEVRAGELAENTTWVSYYTYSIASIALFSY